MIHIFCILLLKMYALFPLRGLGYSVLRKQNTAIPQLWRSPAEDLICHSSKKRRDKTNIPPKNSLTLSRQRHIAPGRTRLPGRGGRSKSPEKKHKIQLSSNIGNIAKIYYSDYYEKNI